jgi:hypothetical protein
VIVGLAVGAEVGDVAGDIAGVAATVAVGEADGDPNGLTAQETNTAVDMIQASNIALFTLALPRMQIPTEPARFPAGLDPPESR